MVATPLSATNRYIQPGVSQFYWVTTIAVKTAPTRTELDAGKDLTNEVAAISGFSVSSDQVAAPDFGKRFTPSVPGMITAADSSINIYLDKDSDDVRSVISQDDEGFVVVFQEGDDEGANNHTMDVWPATVASAAKQESDSDPSQIQYMFTITSEPAIDVDVPASA
jgi:hypothetical protein